MKKNSTKKNKLLTLDDYMPYGQHQGELLRSVAHLNPEYMKWFASTYDGSIDSEVTKIYDPEKYEKFKKYFEQ